MRQVGYLQELHRDAGQQNLKYKGMCYKITFLWSVKFSEKVEHKDYAGVLMSP